MVQGPWSAFTLWPGHFELLSEAPLEAPKSPLDAEIIEKLALKGVLQGSKGQKL